MSSEPDRLYVEKSDLNLYKRLKEIDSPLRGKENKELFILAMLLGYREGMTKELDKKEGYFRASYLTSEEESLLKAIAIDKAGTLGVLLDKKNIYSIAEQHATCGIKLLHDQVLSGEYGTYAKKLESELVQMFEENKRKERPEPKRQEEVNIKELIGRGENEQTEFKSSLCWDYKRNRKNKLIEFTAAKTVSAFMNTYGGYLLIGIGDNGETLGLDKDFSVVKKPSTDTFELHFTNVINKYLGKENRPYAKIWFEPLEEKTIAVVKVSKSPVPVYTKSNGQEAFFIRLGNSSHPLNVREATAYIASHWQ